MALVIYTLSIFCNLLSSSTDDRVKPISNEVQASIRPVLSVINGHLCGFPLSVFLVRGSHLCHMIPWLVT